MPHSSVTAEDIIQSVGDALQFISYYHPPDFISALKNAYELERSAAARDAIAQILNAAHAVQCWLAEISRR